MWVSLSAVFHSLCMYTHTIIRTLYALLSISLRPNCSAGSKIQVISTPLLDSINDYNKDYGNAMFTASLWVKA